MSAKRASTFVQLPEPLLALVAGCFQALADPTRLKILQRLKAGEQTVQQLVADLPWTQPNISRHLAILHRAGLVRKNKVGSYVRYSIADQRILGLCDTVCTHLTDMLAAMNQPDRRARRKTTHG